MSKNLNGSLPNFLRGGGQMGQLIHEKDWSHHQLGTPEYWPSTLKLALSNLLKTAFPHFLWWGKDLYCFYNDAYRPSLGEDGKHPSMLGEKAEIAWSEIWDIIKPLIEEVLRTGKPIWRENQLVPFYRNGSVENIYWTFSYSALMGDDNAVHGIMVTCMETTQSIENLHRLEESEDQLKFAVNAAELGTWDYNPSNHKFQGNRRLKEWFGVPMEEETNLSYALECILPKDRERVEQSIQEALNGENGGRYDITYSISNRRTSEVKIVRALGRSWFNELGEPYRFNGTLQDVTQQEMAAEQLRHANELVKKEKVRFENIVKDAPVGIAMFKGPKVVVDMANPTFLSIIGIPPHRFIGQELFEIFPTIETRIGPLISEVLLNKKSVFREEFLLPLRRKGRIENAYFNFILHPTHKNSDGLLEIMLLTNEITDYVIARNAIEEKEIQFKNLVMQSPVAKAIFRGSDLRIEMANTKMLDHFWGISWEKVEGKKLLEVFPELEGQKYIQILKEVIETGEEIKENDSKAMVVKEGKEILFYVNYVYLPLRELDNSVSGVMITVTDVTNEYLAKKKLIDFSKELEKQVDQRTQLLNKANLDLESSIKKLEKANDELESFAYVSSHDLQEPLRKIQIFTSRIEALEANNLSERGKEFFGKIDHAAKRMRSLIDDLLTFSKSDGETFENEEIDLNKLLRSILEDMSENIESNGARIGCDRLPTIYGVPFQIRQVFENLISNSLKFSKQGVPARVQISSDKANQNEILDLELDKNAVYYKINVQDNGIGFPQGVENKIFEVFQRTHDRTKYEGTGIGLAIVKKIINHHNGAIMASSKEGQGALFTLFLTGV